MRKFLLAHSNHLWERGSLILGFTLFVFFPNLAPYCFTPYATARVFERNELPSLIIFALLGFISDAVGSAFFFGFFTLCFAVIGAFIYSLKHFFLLSRESAFGFCFIFNLIFASTKMIYIGFFLEGNTLFFGTFFTELIVIPMLLAFVCMRLYMAQLSAVSRKHP